MTRRGALAPPWHTALLVALILGVAVLGAILSRSSAAVVAPPSGSPLLVAYLPMVVVAWGLVVYVSRVGRSESALARLVGRVPQSLRELSLDAALAASLFLLIEGSEALVARAGVAPGAAVSALLPHGVGQRAAWVLVAASVGFSEEVVYRGYLQTQLSAFKGVGFGILAQAILFGVAHGQQGAATAARFAVYGLVLGALARRRGSLVPGILAHVAIDVVSGLVTRG